MFYVPGKLLFVHIPRTAGNVITRTLAKHYLKHDSPIVALAASSQVAQGIGIHRHSRAADLQYVIPDFDDILKVAVYRPTGDIVESEYRLHLACSVNDEVLCPAWSESVRMAHQETLQEFEERRWKPWLAGKSAWQHWTYDNEGDSLGFASMRFDILPADWGWLCEKLGLDLPLPVEDWQMEQIKINSSLR